jgi:hypothetical protein
LSIERKGLQRHAVNGLGRINGFEATPGLRLRRGNAEGEKHSGREIDE